MVLTTSSAQASRRPGSTVKCWRRPSRPACRSWCDRSRTAAAERRLRAALASGDRSGWSVTQGSDDRDGDAIAHSSGNALSPAGRLDGKVKNEAGTGGTPAPASGSCASEAFEVATLDLIQGGRVWRSFGGVVAGRLLGFDLDLSIRRHQFGRNRHPLHHLDAGAGDGIVLHVRHGHEPVDALDAEPVQHVGHELLEASILHARHAFGAFEIRRGLIATLLPLARIVDEELRDLAERAAFLAIV